MAKVAVKVSKGKHGTKLASNHLRVTKGRRNSGKPIYQTRAQLHARIYTNSSGGQRQP